MQLIHLAAVVHRDAGRQLVGRQEFPGLVTDHHHAACAFGQQLLGDLGHRQRAIDRLAAGHRNRIVVENLVGDIGAGGDRGPDGEQAGMEIGAVAEIGKHVLFIGEVHLPQPRHALAAHLREGGGVAVHSLHQVVTANAGETARALRHLGGAVVRAAGAIPGLAFRRDMQLLGFTFLALDDGQAGLDVFTHIFWHTEA